MLWLQILSAALAGLALGCLAWLAARRFTGRYRSAAQETSFLGDEASATCAGPTPAGGVVTVGVMVLWGGWVGWQATSLPVAASALVVTSLLLCVTLVDLRVRRIPNELVLALLAWAVVQMLWPGQPDWRGAVAGLAVAGILFYLLALIGRGVVGLGDVKLEAALGALLGYPAVLAAMAVGIIAGGLTAAVLLLTHRAGRKDAFAYGPYLALGAWLVLARVWGLWPG
ncbi:MAG TPA: A24 family peptidase [Anaerolineae bacterium]|nr:A24 family peptidase [Anaerolineae bacterium]